MFWRKRKQSDFNAEVKAHLEIEAERLKEQGLGEEDARAAARRAFGNVTQAEERFYESGRWLWWDHLAQDVRYGLRVLGRNPGFAASAILTLALGIGATTAIFSIVDAVALKPLPFPSADRLVQVRSVLASNVSSSAGVASYPDFLDWRARNNVFDGMAVFRTNDFTLIGARESIHLQGAVISAQLFSLLGVTPALGRGFLPEEDDPATTRGTDPVILSYGLWQREFGSDPLILGRTIQLGNQPFTVIGVMPQTFQFPIQAEPAELWTTIALDSRAGGMAVQRGAHYLDVVALLKPGTALTQAQTEIAGLTSVMNKQHPENKPRTVRILPEIQGLVGPLRAPLFVLLGAVGCVLLIVCVNVANLLLARATGRHKEMALRAALGANRHRATFQMLTESVTLGLIGGGVGLALGLGLQRVLVRLVPMGVPRLDGVGLDARLVVFALTISLLAGLLFGFAPALRASRINLTDSLNEGGRSNAGGKEGTGLRSALVVSEVALAVVLLLGAGLLIQSFIRLLRVNPGFDPHQVLTFQVDAPAHGQDPGIHTFYHSAAAQISALPGVDSVSVVASIPLTGDNLGSAFDVEGEPTTPGSRPVGDFNAVEPGYFRTMRIPIVSGRDFTELDNPRSHPVVMVNQALARHFFPNQNPLGRRVRPGIGNGYAPGEPPMREIVGVIADVKESGLSEEASPEIYAPLAQSPFDSMFIVARTQNDPRTLIAPARREIAALDKNAPIYHVETLDQYFDQSAAGARFVTLLLCGFAVSALLLACLGIYGVISYFVLQRTNEIGIRMALGANRGEVLRMVIGQGLRPSLLGVLIGFSAAARMTRLLASILYDVKPGDPLTFAVVGLILIGVALLACYIPARRATRVDPMEALRYE